MNNTRAINAVVILFVFTAAGVVLISLFVPDNGAALARIGLLTALLAPTIASIAVLARQSETGKTVERVRKEVSKLSNGDMEAKIRAVLEETLYGGDVEKRIKSTLHDVLTERLEEPDEPSEDLHITER